MRICRKVPDLQEHFIEKATNLLSDRNHGVLLCGLTLVTSLCEADQAEGDEQDLVSKFRPLAGGLVKTLKSLAGSGYAPEHDVSGITDPFLQVKILRLLRVLGRGDVDTSEQINDILAQVLPCPDGSYQPWLNQTGGHKHRLIEKCGQLHPLRGGSHHPGDRGRLGPSCAWRQYSREILVEQGQQYSLRRPKYIGESGRRRTQCRTKTPKYHPRVPTRPGYQHPTQGPRP